MRHSIAIRDFQFIERTRSRKLLFGDDIQLTHTWTLKRGVVRVCSDTLIDEGRRTNVTRKCDI